MTSWKEIWCEDALIHPRRMSRLHEAIVLNIMNVEHLKLLCICRGVLLQLDHTSVTLRPGKARLLEPAQIVFELALG